MFLSFFLLLLYCIGIKWFPFIFTIFIFCYLTCILPYFDITRLISFYFCLFYSIPFFLSNPLQCSFHQISFIRWFVYFILSYFILLYFILFLIFFFSLCWFLNLFMFYFILFVFWLTVGGVAGQLEYSTRRDRDEKDGRDVNKSLTPRDVSTLL